MGGMELAMNSNFPDFDDWKDLCINPDDDYHGGLPLEKQYEYYKQKFKICEMVAPRTVLEIGVCWGYSAFSFLCCNSVELYVGIDIDDPSKNGVGVPTLDWAGQNLAKMFGYWMRTVHLIKQDSRAGLGIPSSTRFDFVHVDGDHSYEGCKSDLEMVWPHTSKALLADDYFASTEVHRAVDEFCDSKDVLCFTGYSTVGEALLVK
jgi:hypothetical protein